MDQNFLEEREAELIGGQCLWLPWIRVLASSVERERENYHHRFLVPGRSRNIVDLQME